MPPSICGGPASAAGACRWRPTSPSRSACWRCSASACRLALKVFLLALAIVDDLGAVLVIALFYTAQRLPRRRWPPHRRPLALVAANRLGVATRLGYAVLGVGLWVAHACVGRPCDGRRRAAGLTIPARTRCDHRLRPGGVLGDFERQAADGPTEAGREAALEERDGPRRGGADAAAQPGARPRTPRSPSASCPCSRSPTPGSRSAAPARAA